MEDAKQSQKTELILSGSHDQLICAECEQQITDLHDARAFVIKAAGLTSVAMIPLVILLSFADSVICHRAWILDDRILYVILSGVAAITAFAWRSKPHDQ